MLKNLKNNSKKHLLWLKEYGWIKDKTYRLEFCKGCGKRAMSFKYKEKKFIANCRNTGLVFDKIEPHLLKAKTKKILSMKLDLAINSYTLREDDLLKIFSLITSNENLSKLELLLDVSYLSKSTLKGLIKLLTEKNNLNDIHFLFNMCYISEEGIEILANGIKNAITKKLRINLSDNDITINQIAKFKSSFEENKGMESFQLDVFSSEKINFKDVSDINLKVSNNKQFIMNFGKTAEKNFIKKLRSVKT